MPQDKDEILEFYIKRIESVKKDFPKLTSPEFDSAVQDAVDKWTDDTKDTIGDVQRTERFQRPEDDSPESVKKILEHLKERYDEDDMGLMDSLSEDEDCKELIDELMESVRRHEDMEYSHDIEYMERTSQEVLDTLRSWFKTMSSLDPATRRCLWGLTPSDFKNGLVTDFEKYAKVFRYDKEVRRFTDTLGRKGQSLDSLGFVISPYGDVRVSGNGAEIAGVELGRDISNIVPSELSTMMDEDLSVLFDLKYVEGRLMCFSREDNMETECDDKGDVDSPSNMGPIILICDTSGSMRGAPLFLSKALCFTIITRASQQGRKILRIDFNARSRHVDISPDDHIRQLHEFLTTRASGGTDPGPALREAVKLINDSRYIMADIVVISDFGLDMSNFRRGNRSMIALREHGCRIHSVSIPSRRARDLNDFDSSWGLDSHKGRRFYGTFKEL